MTRDELDRFCAALPGAVWADPADGQLPSWKVGGKMFALISKDGAGISVKCPDIETARMLIEVGAAEKAPYFHRSWVRLPWAGLNGDTARHRIATSYAIIRASLPKKLRDGLGPIPS